MGERKVWEIYLGKRKKWRREATLTPYASRKDVGKKGGAFSLLRSIEKITLRDNGVRTY